MHDAVCPDVDLELSRLKGFQRDTVDYVFQRMYEDQPPARRFLVADEVGLGKTMVARGVVAKALRHLWDSVERIDIIYICSNASIARQNITRLNVTNVKDAALPSRITLLPKVVHGLQQRKVNFISLTPQTSFDLRSSMGTYEERGLLHRLLPEDWTCSKGAQDLLQGAMRRERFHRHLDETRGTAIDDSLLARFHDQLSQHPELKLEFFSLCDVFGGSPGSVNNEDSSRQSRLVGRLRAVLATSCLTALEPDLVIVDEFQRFKHLLNRGDGQALGPENPASLARDLFSYGNARVLLLSATPYKMYTTADDQADDHFRDFIETVEFLQDDLVSNQRFRRVLDRYKTAIFKIGDGDTTALVGSKNEVQQELQCVMVRTERLAVRADRNGMLTEVRAGAATLADADINGYLAATRVARAVGHPDIVEYWKSSPYLLNFMDDYRFKKLFEEALLNEDKRSAVSHALRPHSRALLDWNAVERYLELEPQSGRMRVLINDMIDSGAWRLLWLPPSLSYYKLAGSYADVDSHRLTKRLIFSGWHVVPKTVAALLSYEVERRMATGAAVGEIVNTPDERGKRSGLLRFARRESDGGPGNMTVLGLVYPSISLAELGDPLAVCRESREWLAYDTLLTSIEVRVQSALEAMPAFASASGATDDQWYWAAPILLDLHRHQEAAARWLNQQGLSGSWVSADGDTLHDDDEDVEGGKASSAAWGSHVAEAKKLLAQGVVLGSPPADLVKVLAVLALGAPGPVAVRALTRISGGAAASQDVHLRNEAGWIAWALRSLFNLPEVSMLVRSGENDEPYWQRVAQYCAEGGLQSVLDEFAHVLLEHQGVAYEPANRATKEVAKVIAKAIRLRSANVRIDEIALDDGGPAIKVTRRSMRARFAARFGAKQTDDPDGALRQDDVRTAFNSPFWPFVLCSTSVGQEGLDFHLYCHAVMHWNLPTNPVDLEQREGRVHRYKGHAVRKNVVRQYGDHALESEDVDPWEGLFHLAATERGASDGDLVPYWLMPVEGGAQIERHVPTLPLSREEGQFAALRRSLTIYRMAFGQNRQDDVLTHLRKKCSPETLEQLTGDLRVDLAPRPRTRAVPSAPNRRVATRTISDGKGDETAGVRPDVSLATAISLLDAFRACATGKAVAPGARFKDLLDEYARRRAGAQE